MTHFVGVPPNGLELKHYGMPRRSGRYPWGSGENGYQRSAGWRAYYQDLKKQGLSDVEIARGEGISTNALRARNSISRAEVRAADTAQALKLSESGMSPTAIGRQMGKSESSIRALLDPVIAERTSILNTTADMLMANVKDKRYVDIGSGVESHLGISRTRLNAAVAIAEENGYKIHTVNIPQVGMPGQFTKVKVLGDPESEWKEVVRDFSLIKQITSTSDDFGRTYSDLGLRPIEHVSQNRLKVLYAEDGGTDKDGVIELRRGVSDLDIGGAKYAQVRIGVDGTHFLKGMAIYRDDMPEGVDLIFNTNKHDTGNKLDALKPLKDDPDNPFGATIKPGGQRGALNIVNEEGDWDSWSKTLSSQMLSKQREPLIKSQLDLAFKEKREEFDEIAALTNPVVKRQLLLALADDCDSSSVHLKAAGMPRQASKVILPIPELNPNEIYAPSFRDGEPVVLIRHPHGGVFEIPEVTVNNHSKAAKAVMQNATDAIGIHPKVAQKLSGADFDGDTVIVIPNKSGLIRTAASLKGLENFDPKEVYPPFDGMRTITGGVYNASTSKVEYGGAKPITKTKQTKMGEVSNLITDMTIKGADLDEIARAVRHSMVVIDSEKHNLNYKQSYIDNGISSLAAKYQNSARGGASTLISKAGSEERVPHRASTPSIDKQTGELIYKVTGQTYYDKHGREVPRQTKTTKMARATDAKTLSSGTDKETLYAEYANNLKTLAKTARVEALSVTPIPYSPSAKKTYSKEVATLNAQLNVALKNAPIERTAQILANSVVARKKEANPNMDDDDLKKIKNQALAEARIRTGAHKERVQISPKEWEAIQAGAISTSSLTKILANTDLDAIKQLATPRATTSLTDSRAARAESMLKSGHTLSEVADYFGVSTSTITAAINK